MADCPYCAHSFADESEIRKHLYEDHEYDELSRIDTKRVDQYVDEHDLQGSDDDETRKIRELTWTQMPRHSASFPQERPPTGQSKRVPSSHYRTRALLASSDTDRYRA